MANTTVTLWLQFVPLVTTLGPLNAAINVTANNFQDLTIPLNVTVYAYLTQGSTGIRWDPCGRRNGGQPIRLLCVQRQRAYTFLMDNLVVQIESHIPVVLIPHVLRASPKIFCCFKPESLWPPLARHGKESFLSE